MDVHTRNLYPGLEDIEERIKELETIVLAGKEAEKELTSLKPVIKQLREIAETKGMIVSSGTFSYDPKPINKNLNKSESSEDVWLTTNPFKGKGITDAILLYLKMFGAKAGVEIFKILLKSGEYKALDEKSLRGTVYATLSRLYHKQGAIKKDSIDENDWVLSEV